MKPKQTVLTFAPAVLQCVRSYMLAAGSVAVGLLASFQTSEAKVVFTQANVVISAGQSYNLHLTNNGTTDYTISASSRDANGCPGVDLDASVNTAAGNFVEYLNGGYPDALPPGARIDSSQQFYGGNQQTLAAYYWSPVFGCHVVAYGNWVGNIGTRYLGLKFQFQGKTHFGWARMKVTSNFVGIRIALTGYAFETIANKAIIAGKRPGH